MDNLTLNLVNFSLNMHMAEQAIASKNIANVDFRTKLTTDFSEYLERLEKMPEKQQLQYLQVLNSQELTRQGDVIIDSGEAINIDTEHANSTKAMLEYQALIEVINRKIGMMAVAIGGQR